MAEYDKGWCDMLRTLFTSGISWIFSKGFSTPLWIALCLGIGLQWYKNEQLFEVQSIVFEERLLQEKALAASWKVEALRLQGIILVSGDTLRACLDREVEEVQAQITLRRLVQDLRQKVPQSSLSFIPSCTGHEQIMEYLERPLGTGKNTLPKFSKALPKASPEALSGISTKEVLP